MKLGQKLVSLIGLFALLLGMTAGIAAAQPPGTTSTSSMELGLNVQCLDRTDVTISGNGAMQTALQGGGSAPTSSTGPVSNVATTNPNAIKVQVNVGCYFGPWTVNADVSDFRNGSDSFDGSRLDLIAGPVSSYYNGSGEIIPFGPGDPLAPRAHNADFGPDSVPGDSEQDIFHTQRFFWSLYPWIPVSGNTVQRAPWTSTAQYTGQVNLGGVTLEQGTYTATLTVELVLEDSGHGNNQAPGPGN